MKRQKKYILLHQPLFGIDEQVNIFLIYDLIFKTTFQLNEDPNLSIIGFIF